MGKRPFGERMYILDKLEAYQGVDSHEEAMRLEVIVFIRDNNDCFERNLPIGHVTGSAWIVNPTFEFVLLTHHTKLGRWLQLGGHSDGNPDTLAVALREATEESGLMSVHPLSEDIFDIDVHVIRQKGTEPEHIHYDIRFLFTADEHEPLSVSTESKDLKWVRLVDVQKLNTSDALERMVRKTELLHP